ncbi:MAG: OPT/YSL family transporter, partial [Negativicutes bacterium]|nr:OPT/YSL family transporter [Negativicutes bacterium]
VSGLTLLTLVLGAEVMLHSGLAGPEGMAVVLMMCAVVCGCLFMTGCFVGDLKAAYWIGATPQKLQFWKLTNIIVSACISAGVVLVLAKSYGFGEGGLVAPQGNAMAAVINPLMSGQEAPWTLYVCGAFIAVLLNWLGVPALAFGLGLYVPLHLNTPLLLGGVLAKFVSGRSGDSVLNKQRHYRGVLISSGFIAGGSLMGVLSACLHVAGYDFEGMSWAQTSNPELLSLVVILLIAGYYIFDCLANVKKNSAG